MKPKLHIETKWEEKEGFPYLQPVEYINGRKLTYEVIRDFKNIYRVSFSDILHENFIYNQALHIINGDLHDWFDNSIKEETINTICNHLINSETADTITKLLPFEIYLLQDGYDMISLGGLNATSPKRTYQKEDLLVSLNLGIKTHTPYPFYFTDSRLLGVNAYYEPINNREDYLLYRDDIEQWFNKTKPYIIKKGDGFIIPNIELKL